MSLTMNRTAVKRCAQSFASGDADDSKAIVSFFSSLDTPKSLAAYILFREGEHVQLLDLDVCPEHYLDCEADKFHRDYLAVSFLSKSNSLITGYDKKKRGFAKFFEFEEQCKSTNLRFKSYRELENSRYATWLFVMRRKIDLILGEFDVEEFFDKSAWGPGVTTLLKGSDTSATRKFQSEIGITGDAYTLMKSSMAAAYPGWFRSEHVSDSAISIQAGNTVTSVPKNSKIDRIIAVEPGLNLYFQKGVGGMIKKRLRRRGIDLTNQSMNQALAMQGSITGDLATVDFSSASDSIASAVVEKLLPLRWYTVMNDLRSKIGSFDGSTFKWEKFSSMGNGFTFELESLLFYAAALTSCELNGVSDSDVSVYGDDVIIPSSIFDSFREFCVFLGFTVNTSKSFADGVFRESCGSHYFRGVDVKPIYHKESLSDAFSVFKLANSIRRLSHRRNFNYGCDIRFLATWRCILQRLPVALRGLKIPEGYGDGGVLSNFDEACPPSLRFGHEGFSALALSERGVTVDTDCAGLLQERLTQVQGTLTGLQKGLFGRVSAVGFLKSARGLSTQSYSNSVTLRGQVAIRVSELAIPSWYNLGGWE